MCRYNLSMPGNQHGETRGRWWGGDELLERESGGGGGLRAALAGIVRSSTPEVEARGPIAGGEDHLGVGIGLCEVEGGWHLILIWHCQYRMTRRELEALLILKG